MSKAGAILGSGGVIIGNSDVCAVDLTRNLVAFEQYESCGKCFPCRIGTQRLEERLSGSGPSALEAWKSEVTDMGAAMKATSACGLGMAAPFISESLLKYFPDQIAQRVQA